MKSPRRRVNWYLYLAGVAVAAPGAWLAIRDLGNGVSLSIVGLVAMLCGVYLIRAAYYRPTANSELHNHTVGDGDARDFLFSRSGWHVIRLIAIIAFATGIVVLAVLSLLLKFFSNNYVAGLVGAYAFLGAAGVVTFCAALEVMRWVHRVLPK